MQAYAEPAHLGQVRVRISIGKVTTDKRVAPPGLTLSEDQSVVCSNTTTPCPTLPVASAWSEKAKDDTRWARDVGITSGAFARASVHPDTRRMLLSASDGLRLLQLPDRTSSRISTPPEHQIDDYDWIGPKGCFLVLTSTYENDLKPWYWLSALSGHPVQRHTYHLSLYDPNGAPITSAIIVNRKQDATARLVRVPTIDPAGSATLGPPC